MHRFAFRVGLVLGSLLGLRCGGDSASQCLRDTSCDPGFRCERGTPGEPGRCVACDPVEVPYDGLDNDCNSRTLDLDLDGDGDNAVSSAFQTGGDCDDDDPAVSSKLPERCDDGKDNNCNTVIDEPACRDFVAPTLSFLRPLPGAQLRGRIDVELDATDDVAVKQVELFANGSPLGTISSPPFVFSIDTVTLTDGQVMLRAVATDVAERTAEATIGVVIDNFTGPAITPLRPQPGRSYGGRMTVSLEASDAAGVASVTLSVDGATLGTYTSTPYASPIDTRGLADGIHTAELTAVDATGATSRMDVDFLVDNTGPVVSLAVSPSSGGAVQGTITVTVNAVDSAGVGGITSRVSSVSGTDTLTYTLDSLAIPNGPLVLTATATDLAEVDDGTADGNRASGSVSLNVSNPTNAPPRVVLTAPVAGDGVYRRSIITADANSPQGVSRVRFYVEGTPVGYDDTTPFSVTADFSRYSGVVTVSATAIDSVGVEATDSATVTVARPATFRAPIYLFPDDVVDQTRHAVGDVNGDSIPDLVMAGSGVSLLLGLGGGSFEIARALSINSAAQAVAIGDTDGDGMPDILALHQGSLDVFLNNGGGAFLSPTNYPFGNLSPTDFALADLNGDGRLDVAIARKTAGGDFIVMLNRDNMGFGDVRAFGNAGAVERLVLGDVDDDGDLDVLLGRRAGGDDYFTTYRNDGTATFGAGIDTLLPGQPYSVALGDMNQDGVPDVVAAIPAPGTTRKVVVAYGSAGAPGQFGVGYTVDVGSAPSGVALGDLDRDGDLEAVITAEKSHTTTVLTRISDSSYSRADYVVARDARHPVLWDVDGDGDLDLFVSSKSNDAVALVFNRNGTLLAPPAVELATAPGGVVLRDLSGDGRPEAVVARSSAGTRQPATLDYFANQQGRLTYDHEISLAGNLQPNGLAIGDLDGLGGLDFAVSTAGPGSRLVLDAGGMASEVLVAAGRARDVAIGDVDNDGAPEAVFSFDQTTVVSGDGVRIFNPSGVMEQELISGEGAMGIAVGYLNNDQLIDVAVANNVGDNVAFFTVTGGTVQKTVFSGITAPWAVTLGRVGPAPADALNDLLVSGSNRVGVLRGHPTLDFTPPTTWDAAGNPSRIAAGDFNRDGMTDVVVIQPSTDRIAVLIARERGGFFGPDLIDVGAGPTDLRVDDVDGDGTLDVVVVSNRVETLAVVHGE
ncbi:MAG: VCBS repeat-containing protein [Deltaproteobacteria bacterium]|nr:VCBS repeat-containing protein [Deltaproteobacteria bacterium]